jgi:glycosyltransferase involved in cell wall biosynthesis/predicted O-methyltransferase YrrM
MSLRTVNEFSHDWTSQNIENWKVHLAPFERKPVEVLEIGSFEGRSAVFFLEYLQQSRITCVDTFNGSAEHRDPASRHHSDVFNIERRFDKNLAGYVGRVEKLKGSSIEVLRGIHDREFDIVYVDGDHSASAVFADATQCWKLLREGGVMIFDDYLWEPQLPASLRPQSGIDAFLDAIDGQYELLHKEYQVIICRTQEKRTFNKSEALNISVAGETAGLVDLPLVSFIVVNRNYARYVGQTIDSIAAQDYPNFECIIVDNGSDDGSLDVIEKHAGNDPRFSILRLPSNLGQLGAVFKGLKEVKGRFLVIVDSDDVLFPTFASTHVQVHLAAPENVAVTSSNVIEIDGAGKALSSQYARVTDTRNDGDKGLRSPMSVARLPQISDAVYAHLHDSSRTLSYDCGTWIWSPGTSNMIRTTAARLFDRDDSGFIRSSDTYFLPLCHAVGGTTIIDVPLSAYRIHGSNDFSTSESMWGFNAGAAKHVAEHFPNSFQNLEVFFSNLELHAVRLGPRFWKSLENVHFGSSNKRTPGYFELFLHNAEPLRRVTGDRNFFENIRIRFDFLQAARIIIASAEGKPRIRMLVRLFRLRMRKILTRVIKPFR